ncbi:DUF4105 domain-containing protein [Flavobacteriaceae bacterium TP-CH-4]|uniref:DUF4105 domain-containing protein n=1 Tax=Pelagihabitans pacificus TaxID=2696054 RepID=A0A967APB4_9FLAO|nr:DUF4105 domain-containing protein [Pelagihabitans pacificus]NHF57789.1 DUF4105 domain-containing protein [Pelagihabitans pacificus]
MQFKTYLFSLFVAWVLIGNSQPPELSPLSKVSVLTVGTADELHSKFGHSAIRLQDPTIGLDIVYNYGLFDFDDPNFYVKFTRGKLDYRLGRQRFQDFLQNYRLENRWVREQMIKLTEEQRSELFQFLENNHLPENRYYKYDFLFDNCSTRVPDALKTVLGASWTLKYDHLDTLYTFRELIHQNLTINSWSNFGIDLALGSVIDRQATPWEHMFLPIYVFKQLPFSSIDGKPMVYSESELLAELPSKSNSNFLRSPLFWLLLLLLLVIGITIRDALHRKRTAWLDFLLFFVTGAAGSLILFLWFATDHQATKMNFNVFWAFAPNLAVAFLLFKDRFPKWFTQYLWVLVGLLLTTLLLWVLEIQIFSPLILFLLGALMIRYLFLVKKSRELTENV